jgi:hypothetical protein
LKLLRAAGFRDDLPPSTDGWLETNPVFQWLSDNLSSDNFVSPEDAAEYAELSLQGGSSEAKQKDALASAMGLSDDDSSSDSEDEGLQDPLTPEQLRAAIQVRVLPPYAGGKPAAYGTQVDVGCRVHMQAWQHCTTSTLLSNLCGCARNPTLSVPCL